MTRGNQHASQQRAKQLADRRVQKLARMARRSSGYELVDGVLQLRNAPAAWPPEPPPSHGDLGEYRTLTEISSPMPGSNRAGMTFDAAAQAALVVMGVDPAAPGGDITATCVCCCEPGEPTTMTILTPGTPEFQEATGAWDYKYPSYPTNAYVRPVKVTPEP